MKITIALTIACLLIATLSKSQTQNYAGTSDGEKIKATIKWNADKTITANYYFNSNPARIYLLTGTNYVDGEIEVIETYNGRRTGTGTLYKTLEKGKIIWSGYIEKTKGNSSYLYLTRAR